MRTGMGTVSAVCPRERAHARWPLVHEVRCQAEWRVECIDTTHTRSQGSKVSVYPVTVGGKEEKNGAPVCPCGAWVGAWSG